jgi:hypothetical protein
MHKLVKFILPISILFVAVACKNEVIQNYKEIVIDNTKIADVEDISDVIDSVGITRLLETPGNYIGDVFKVYLSNGKYIIFDRIKTRKIYLFGSDGTFIKTIIKPGSGPNEALQLNDCWLNYKGELEAYDFAQKKIYQFDTLFNLKNIIAGNKSYIFKSLYRLPKSGNYLGYATFDEFNPSPDDIPFHLAVLDQNLDIVKTALPFDKAFRGIEWVSLREHFNVYGDSIRFVESSHNFIYDVTNLDVRKRFKLVYADNPLPDDIMETIVMDNLDVFKDRESPPSAKTSLFKKYTAFTGTWLENDRYIYISSRQGYDFPFYTIINKQRFTVDFNAKRFSESKRYKLKLAPFQFYDNQTGQFISVISGADLKSSLYADSPFQNKVMSDPSVLYIVTVKLKK